MNKNNEKNTNTKENGVMEAENEVLEGKVKPWRSNNNQAIEKYFPI